MKFELNLWIHFSLINKFNKLRNHSIIQAIDISSIYTFINQKYFNYKLILKKKFKNFFKLYSYKLVISKVFIKNAI